MTLPIPRIRTSTNPHMELFFSLFVVEHVGLFPSGYAHPFIPNAIINAIAQIVHPEYVSHFLTDHFVIIRMKCGDDFLVVVDG